jgi:hypothetical protein
MQWRNLLRSFGNVKKLLVCGDIATGLSRSLQIDDGESAMELLPELEGLSYYASGERGDAFISFTDARRNVGHPVTLVRL